MPDDTVKTRAAEATLGRQTTTARMSEPVSAYTTPGMPRTEFITVCGIETVEVWQKDENIIFSVALAAFGNDLDKVIDAGFGRAFDRELARMVLEECGPIIVAQNLEAAEAIRCYHRYADIGATPIILVFRIAKPVKEVKLHEPVTNFREEAQRIGVSINVPADRSEALRTVLKIAHDSRDLFPNDDAILNGLLNNPIDGSGKTAVDLVRERGSVALLIKLDQMRFGANG